MNKKALQEIEPEIAPFLVGADHVDVKTIAADLPMRAFIAGMMSYHPGWLKFLYAVRWGFVRLLGMKQEGMPLGRPLQPTDIPLTPGDMATFFQVVKAEDERYWIAEASDKHLAAFIGLVVDDSARQRQFHAATIVKYRHWTGPVYFNVIRPFHHIVVCQMMRAGTRYELRVA